MSLGLVRIAFYFSSETTTGNDWSEVKDDNASASWLKTSLTILQALRTPPPLALAAWVLRLRAALLLEHVQARALRRA